MLSGTTRCSLVKKDAGMLDAFGKGASEDIQHAKGALYSQMTYNPATNTSLNADAVATPPLSPKHGQSISTCTSLPAGFITATARAGTSE